MNVIEGVIVYFMLWWISAFVVFPFGMRTQADDGEYVQGTEPGAPTGLKWRRILLWNTAVAAVGWVIAFLVVSYDLLGVVQPWDPTAN